MIVYYCIHILNLHHHLLLVLLSSNLIKTSVLIHLNLLIKDNLKLQLLLNHLPLLLHRCINVNFANVKGIKVVFIILKVFIFAIELSTMLLDNVLLLHHLHCLLLNVTDFKHISPFFINNPTDSKKLYCLATDITTTFTLPHHFHCTINHHLLLLILLHFHLNIFHYFHIHLLKTTELFIATRVLNVITQLTTVIICYCYSDCLQLLTINCLISTWMRYSKSEKK